MPDYPTAYPIRIHPRVSDALNAAGPVVALESTIVAHGLPRPENLTVARDIEQEVRAHGAEPATIGMIDGQIWVGLDDDQLTTLATADDVAKLAGVLGLVGRLVEGDDVGARLDALERAARRWGVAAPSPPDTRPGGPAQARRREAVPAQAAAAARSA